jgi:hypothetical protein
MKNQRRLLILANSVKKHERCVAGREIVRVSPLNLGDWVRPVSAREGGALSQVELKLKDGGAVQVFDDVIACLNQHHPGEGQPENWTLGQDAPWERKGRIPMHRALASLLEETPPSLWGAGAAGRSDRVAPNSPELSALNQSLTIIRPRNMEFHLEREKQTKAQAGSKKSSRAAFTYRGTQYEMPITDDAYTNKNLRNLYPQKVGEQHRATIRPEKPCLLCVSLTEPFNGFHYKVIATILEEA